MIKRVFPVLDKNSKSVHALQKFTKEGGKTYNACLQKARKALVCFLLVCYIVKNTWTLNGFLAVSVFVLDCTALMLIRCIQQFVCFTVLQVQNTETSVMKWCNKLIILMARQQDVRRAMRTK